MSTPNVPEESELDRAERRLMQACNDLGSQTEATMAAVRRANEALPQIKAALHESSRNNSTSN